MWAAWTEVVADESDFARIGADFEAAGAGTTGAGTTGAAVGQVGEATARLMRQRALVDFGTSWIAAHRR
jgi:aminoglycoside 3-N-acetyltransferase